MSRLFGIFMCTRIHLVRFNMEGCLRNSMFGCNCKGVHSEIASR